MGWWRTPWSWARSRIVPCSRAPSSARPPRASPGSMWSMSESPRPPDPDPDPDERAVRSPSEVLVIGGGGFIGSHLVDRLVAERVPVDVVDDLSTGSLGNLADARNAARLTGA